MKLTRTEIIKLINFYQQKECLWNYKSAFYKRLDKKNKAWSEISREFNASVSEIKKKVKHLRTAYIAEKKKVQASKKSGSSADLYSPCLFYYEKLRFLDDVIALRSGITSNLNLPIQENPSPLEDFEQANGCMYIDQASEDLEYEEENLNDETFTENENCRLMKIKTLSKVAETPEQIEKSTNSKAKRLRMEKSATKAAASKISSRYQAAIAEILGAVSKQPEDEDAYAAFGRSIALRLRQLPQLNSAEAMLDLEGVMLKHTRRALSVSPI